MRTSIFGKLALTFLVIVAGLVAFLGLSTGRELETSFSSLVKDREVRITRGIGLEVDLSLTGLENQLKGMSDNFDLRRLIPITKPGEPANNDPELIRLVGMLRDVANIEWLWLVSPDGKLLATGHDPLAFGENVLQPPGPRAEMISRAIKEETVRTVTVESIAAQNVLVEEVFLPVTEFDRLREREQVVAILIGATRIDSEFMARSAELAGGLLIAVGPDIHPIASWQQAGAIVDPALMDALSRGQSEINFQDGTYSLATLPFPRSSEGASGESPVTLHLLIPKSDLLARRRTLLGSIIFEAIVGGLIAIVFAFLIAKSITRPIERLKSAVTDLATGDLSKRVDVHSGDEVEDLVKAFNTMADDLETNTQRLVEAEKLSAWREVARRLAHEIKNPLSPIKLSIQHLVRVYKNTPATFEPQLMSNSETILDAVDRLSKLADEFSNFARMPKPVLAPADITEVLRTAVSLFDRPEIGISIEFQVAKKVPPVLIDPDSISGVFTNLLKNAVEAMAGRKGKVRVGVTNVRSRTGEWVQITIADDGVGMDETALKQAFNPYFTTKAKGGGTGLGLAIVQNVVLEHGGRIRINSEVGKGTVVTLVLPAANSGTVTRSFL